MNNQSLVTQESDQEIPCMLLPMVGHALLVPTTTVAEMSAMKPLSPASDGPEWLIGYYDWRGMQVPVVSIETINGEGEPKINPDGRIAVFNNTGVSNELPFIAIHTQGIPRMTRIAENDIAEQEGVPKRPFDVMAVKVGMEELYIPDVSAIEVAYLNLMGSAH